MRQPKGKKTIRTIKPCNTGTIHAERIEGLVTKQMTIPLPHRVCGLPKKRVHRAIRHHSPNRFSWPGINYVHHSMIFVKLIPSIPRQTLFVHPFRVNSNFLDFDPKIETIDLLPSRLRHRCCHDGPNNNPL